ncbi:MAG: MmgE/PrpD family protein [Xanthomonadales bacterium]|nr:MmgE/PrpD family protein [Xanthomonadales bacterium]
MSPERQLVRFALGTGGEALRPEAREALGVILADTLAVMLAGLRAPVAAPLHRSLERWGTMRGPLPASAPDAALLLAFAIHNQEFDAVHERAVVHPLATLGGALLAELRGATRPLPGPEWAAALALGIDLAAALGRTATRPMRFFRPAMASGLAATLVLSKLRGLDEVRAERALGLMLAQLSGTLQAHVEGSPALALQMGFAAAAAQRAVDLAAAGCEGPREALGGTFGYFALYEPEADLGPLAALEPGRALLELALKPWPTGRAAHGALTALEDFLAEGGRAETLAELRLEAPPLVARLVGRPWRPEMGPNYARLCLPWLAARLLAEGRLDLGSFSPAALASPPGDPALAVLAAAEGDPNALGPQRLVLGFRDGHRREIAIEAALGSPSRPLDGRRRAAKIRHCLAHAGLGAEAEIGLYRAVSVLVEGQDARAALELLPWPEPLP